MVTLILLLAAVSVGAFVFTAALWATGFGSIAKEAGDRLTRLKGDHSDDPGGTTGESLGQALRSKANVNFGGMTLVSGKVASSWAMLLEQAGLNLTVKEYFILRLSASGGAGLLGVLLFSPMPVAGLALSPIAFVMVGFFVKRRISTRRNLMEAQLVEMLQMVSSSLRAGFGLLQALEAAASQLPAPISIELRRTIRDTAVGAGIEQAMEALNKRTASPDFDIAITAILIQRAVGGNLAEILENLAHTLRERERIRGEIRALTSQQRLTGYVIGGIPIGLGAFFGLTNPEYVSLLVTDPLGRMMLAGAVGFEVLGFLVIQKIVNIEV